MKITKFEAQRDLIVIRGRIWGRSTAEYVYLAMDTGAAETLLLPSVLHKLGYGPEDSVAKTVIRSAIGVESGYMVIVARLSVLGFALPDCPVHAHDLPDEHGIDGLLGLRFLHNFGYTVHSRRGEISVELAAP